MSSSSSSSNSSICDMLCCCFGRFFKTEADRREYTALESNDTISTVENNIHQASDRSTPNYQSILENASSVFIPAKARVKGEGQSGPSTEAIRIKLQNAVVSSSLAESPPLLQRFHQQNGASSEIILNNLSRQSSQTSNESILDNTINQIVEMERVKVGLSRQNLPDSLATFGMKSSR